MAFTAIGALVAGEAVTTSLVLGAMTEIGVTMSVVGMVTGNKTLLKVGSVIGLVGGVGGLMSGAISGAAGATADVAAGGVADTALNGADVMSDAYTASGATGAGGFGSQAVAGVSGGATDLSGLVDDAQQSLGQTVNATNEAANVSADAANKTADAVTGQSDLMDKTGATPDAMKPDTRLMGNGPAATSGDVNGMDLNSDQATTSGKAPDGSVNTGVNTASQGPPVGPTDYFKRFLGWVNDNQKLANGIMTLGGGVMKGIGERSMFDQKMAIEQMKYGHGNEVASYGPRALIGGR